MSLQSLAGKLSFGHLTGLAGKKGKTAQDEIETAPADDQAATTDTEEDAAAPESPAAEDDPAAAAANTGDDSGDDDEDEDEDEEGDDDSDREEMGKKSAVSRARLRERTRCAAIFASAHAAGNLEMAATLAFTTNLSRSDAINVLAAAPKKTSLDRRLASVRNPDLGAGAAAPSTGPAVATSWDKVMAKVRPAGK